jgi:hypothetical protein
MKLRFSDLVGRGFPQAMPGGTRGGDAQARAAGVHVQPETEVLRLGPGASLELPHEVSAFATQELGFADE